MNLRRVLIVAAIAAGLISSGPVGSDGFGEVAAAHAKGAPKKAAPKKAAKPVKGGKAGAKKGGKQAKTAAKKASSWRGSPQRSVVGNHNSAKIKVCKQVVVGKGKKAKKRKKCSMVKEFQGHGAGKLESFELTKPSGDIWLRSDNLQEEVRVQLYKPDGSYDESALAALDNIFRCKRSKEVRAMDPRLYDQLSRIQDHFGGKQITVVSGFRFVDRDSSRHFHASAIDIVVKGESVRAQYDYAQSLDRGGMGIGIYPHSGFIHVDFRAPGENSYRWTDLSGPGSSWAKKGKKKGNGGRTARAKRPTS
jgi:uncharacterized protein YcbK (DUF882 family)